jgi:hypothetical protein
MVQGTTNVEARRMGEKMLMNKGAGVLSLGREFELIM